jgi:hypothetical protein
MLSDACRIEAAGSSLIMKLRNYLHVPNDTPMSAHEALRLVTLIRPTIVSLFEVFYVFFISFRTLNSKIVPTFVHHVQFLTKLNFYFHERDSRELK